MATHTSVGLNSELQGRGTGDRVALASLVRELGPLHALGASDVAVVQATLAPNGTTDWHGHPGPSIVIVTAGTVRVIEPGPRGLCITTDHATGTGFFHEEGAQNFVNVRRSSWWPTLRRPVRSSSMNRPRQPADEPLGRLGT